MSLSRDNFTKKTVEILAKRVGYLCSNPDCRRHTIGPNEDLEKTTIIGVAAHITAASQGGPRFDENLTTEQRINIDNAIWLCSNCSTLIDKDKDKYSVSQLKKWRSDTELELTNNLKGIVKIKLQETPFIEADLIWGYGGRMVRGHSSKNKELIVLGQDFPIIIWALEWHFSITLYNNSKFDAYNIKIEPIGAIRFNSISKINKINYLPALQNIDLQADYKQILEGTYLEADSVLANRIPTKIEGLKLKISYFDESRKVEVVTIATIINQELINSKE